MWLVIYEAVRWYRVWYPITKKSNSYSSRHKHAQPWQISGAVYVQVRDTKDIKNNAWVTVNNDFWVTSEAICQSLANRITSDPKSLFTVTNVLFYFLHAMLCPWTHNSAKNNHRSLISLLSPKTVVSDLALWRHRSGSVTSRERKILALWRHICRLFLHAQIGAKAIFTSE